MKLPRKIKHQFPFLRELIGDPDTSRTRVQRLDMDVLEERATLDENEKISFTIIYRAMFLNVAEGDSLLEALRTVGAIPDYVLKTIEREEAENRPKLSVTIYKNPRTFSLEKLLISGREDAS